MRRLFRSLKILFIICRFRLDRLLPRDLALPFPARLAIALVRLAPEPADAPSTSLRLAFESLGPIFIKFGQILSTRKDLFEETVSGELQKLQDQVPPFESSTAIAIIESAFGQSLNDLFSSFDSKPLASASVAQVHPATLPTGEDVVVKVIRPGIEQVIQRDLELMYLMATLLERFWEEGRRLHPVAVVADYEHTILDELNLQLEAANAARLRSNWTPGDQLYVPKIYWDLTHQDAIVIERIYGLQVSDIEGLKAAGTNMRKLAHLGVEIFFTQVFEQNFFHADMHPGNVYVNVTDPENPTYIALDCAIMGSLTDEDKDYLAKNLWAFFNQDYRAVATLHVESGWVPADTNVQEFETVIRSVCEPIFQKPIKEISFGKLLVTLFQTARRFNMEVQPQLVLLQKTLLNIEGLGRQVYPDLDLWESAAPFMERWMAERLGVRGVLNQFRKDIPRLIEELPGLPALAIDALSDIKQLNRQMEMQTDVMRRLQLELDHQHRRNRSARWGGLALLAALAVATFPLTADAAGLVIGSSVVGGLGIYLTFIRP